MEKFWFRLLNAEEADLFREEARKNYVPFTDIKGIWHPVYQQECVTINLERSIFVPDKKEEE